MKIKIGFMIVILLSLVNLVKAQNTAISFDLNGSLTSGTYIARDYIKLTSGFTSNSNFTAQIDEKLILDLGQGGYFSSEIQPPSSINPLAPIGCTAGSPSVTPTGGATYSIPIFIAPGTGGMQPSISIVYNSQGSNGLLGKGWDIGGLSAISRVPQTIYTDGQTGGVNLEGDDRFALDGNRLLLLSGVYGNSGATYETENMTFSKIETITSGSSYYFKVSAKDGKIVEYGNSENSRAIAAGSSVPYMWRVNKITDSFGNYMTFTYRNVNGESVIDNIDYTGNANAGLSTYNQLQFSYAKRDDKNTMYVGNSGIDQALLLQQLTSICEGKPVRTYNFDYTKDILNESHLNKITETGSNGQVLNPTIINWGEVTESINVKSFNTIFDGKVLYSGDFNGDGRTDYITIPHIANRVPIEYNSSDQWQLYTTNEDGQSFSFKCQGYLFDYSHFKGVEIADGNNDGKDDIYFHIESPDPYPTSHYTINKYKYYQFDGNNLIDDSSYDKNMRSINPFCQSLINDFDGDGKTDFILLDENKNFIDLRLSTVSDNDVVSKPIFNTPDKVIMVDMNGDGKKDIMVIKKDVDCKVYTYNNASKSFTNIYSSGFPTYWHRIFPGDFNGDGKTDLLTWVADKWYINYSTGTSFTYSATPNTLITSTVDPDLSTTNYNYIISDFNGDGKSDIMEFFSYYSGTKVLNVFYSTGNGFIKEFTNLNNNVDWILAGKSGYDKFDDLNGDGKADIFLVRGSGISEHIITFHANEQTGFVSKITNGYNQSVNFTYESLSTGRLNYTKGSGSQFPLNDIQVPMYVVSSISIPDGVGGNSITTYKYSNAKIHRQGLGFMGFQKVESENWDTFRYTTSENSFETTGVNPSYRIKDQVNSSGFMSTETGLKTIVNASTTYFSNTQPVAGSKAWFTYPTKVIEYNVLTGSYVTTTNNYMGNIDGNIYSITKDFGVGFTETTTFENYVKAGSYVKADGNGLPNKPQKITVTRKHPDDINSFTNQTSFTYDAANGNVLTKTENSHLVVDKQVTTTYSNFDSFGNAQLVSSIGKSEGGDVNLKKTYVYETAKGRFMISSTDALGITASYTYEPVFGNIITEHLSNMSISTEYVYDVWGRLTSKSLPDGNSIATTISWSSDIGPGKPLYYTCSTNSANSVWSKMYYDELGRVLKDETVGFAGIIKYSTTKYFRNGQIDTKASYLGNDKIAQTSYWYYDDGRVSNEINNLTGAETYYHYTTGTNEIIATVNGKTYKKYFDNWGNLKRNDEPAPGGSIYYKYFSHGKPSSIQSPVSTIDLQYDELGQQTSLTDPDAGMTAYRYDAFGRLTYQKSANGDETKQGYDSYGRLQKVTDGAGTIKYQFEYSTTLGAEFGKLKKKATTISGPYESYSYDELGRIQSTTKYIDAANQYTYTNVYDQAGNISKIIYPGDNIVNNQYDEYGILNKVLFTSAEGTATNIPVWTLNTSNATTLNYSLGNGLTTTKSYDTSKGYSLSSIVTANGINQVQSCYYDFNAINGNLNSREDRRTGYKLKESFDYDALYRLTGWSVAKNEINAFSNSLAYKPDQSGNIDSKTDIGTYGFGITGKPHWLSSLQLTQPSFAPTAPQNITYTSFGKVSELTDQDYKVLFTYGSDQQRCKGVMQSINGTTLYTMYYGGAYEKKVMTDGTITQYTYIPAGDGLAAVFLKTGSAAGTLCYVHTDYLGSITALTNASGNIAQEYAYDPWGRRRNPADWSFTNVPAPTLLSRGFTGHEHIDEITLINMNGRIYDPVLGMFISPDNFVQSPTQSQNFNRYTYAMGNPLKYTDPDGNFFFIIGLGYALMQADIAGHASKNHAGNYWSGFGKSMGVSAAGMIVGAGVGSVVGSLLPSGTTALGSTLWGGASGALSGGITGGVMNSAMGGSFKNGFINGAIGGGIMGAISGYVKYSESGRILESRIGGSVRNEDIITNADNYNSSISAEGNDIWLEQRMQDEFNVGEGDFNIKQITTRTSEGYGMTINGKYVNLKSGNLVGGYYYPRENGYHISPYYTYADAVSFRAIAGHELIHAYHHFTIPHFKRDVSERVAYRYTSNIYLRNGRYSSALATMRSAMYNTSGSFWGTYPKQYEIPSVLRFYH